MTADQAGLLALGATLRSYTFDRYKTKIGKIKPGTDKADIDEDKPVTTTLTLAVADLPAAKKRWADHQSIADGVVMARDLVNEPANVLFPEEFARRAAALKKLGVAVEVLDVDGDEEARHGRAARRRAGLARATAASSSCAGTAARTSDAAGRLHRQGRLLRHRRHLDQAGRRHGGHEGRHGGRGLRRRPDARARRAQGQGQRRRRHRPRREHAGRQRPAPRRHRHDRCRARPSRSSTPTPKAASCWPTCSGTSTRRFKPKFMIDLATLTGAIIVALGQEYAGLFSNDDELVERLTEAGRGDRRAGLAHAARPRIRQDDRFEVRRHEEHRRPLRRLDHRGAIPAALRRTRRRGRISTSPAPRMGSPQTDINKSWGSGWGVRLLDRLVRDHYELERVAVLIER